MRTRGGCIAAGAAVLLATVLPWSSTGGPDRNGWDTASLALALDEALREPLLAAVATAWFAVPVLAALAVLTAVVGHRPWAALALRVAGALVVLVVATISAGIVLAGWALFPLGPSLAVAGGAALLLLAGRLPARTTPGLPSDGTVPGVRP
jgi:hypothetical protein